MQASFVTLRTVHDADSSTYLLVCRKDVLPAVLKRLRMFVLRSKVTLDEATEGLALYGLLGEAALAAWGEGAEAAQPWSYRNNGERHLVWLYPAAEPDARVPRALCVQDSSLPPPAGAALDPSLWELSEVRSGVPMVSEATYEAFVPQMVNYESVGGVNFKKGCYPGQEVVARSQFRGAIKRRAYVGHVAGAAQAGQEVFSAADPDQPVGQIAQAASADGAAAVIAVLQVAEVAAGAALHLGSASGPVLAGLAIPYPLAEDI